MSSEIKHDRKVEFEEVALNHMDSLYNTAVYLTGNETDARDLVQETYLRAYRFFHLFEKGTNCRAWLFKILQNNFRNRLRSKSREPVKAELPDNDSGLTIEDTLTSDYSSPFEELEQRNMEAAIYKAIQKLPEKLRAAVVLADLEELSYQEIAEVLECPVGTVRSRIARGRSALRELLVPQAKDLGYSID